MNDRKVFVLDIETIANIFTLTAINVDTEEISQFIIWKNKNQLVELIEFLEKSRGHITFNGNNFDYPVIHDILLNKNKLLKMNGERVARYIYRKAQQTIEKEWPAIKNPLIHQLDLFAIHHFNNKAKLVSLKKLEMALGFKNIQDMPHHHSKDVTTDEQVNEILAYNLNDVQATKFFYEKTLDKIELRKGLYRKYQLPCLNYSDSKIGEELVLKLYADHTTQNPDSIKKRRTYRSNFKFKDCIPKYVKFKTKEFNELFEYIKGIEVTEIKDSFHYDFTYNDFTFFLGTGGIHGSCKEGIYEENEEYIIIDSDVASLYPSIAVNNRYYPQHLGEEFCDVYSEILKERLEAKKSGDKTMADGYKLSLNSVYGKSNSEYSFLYDPLYTLKTTLTGQMSLCMLSEMLFLGIPGMKMLQINTDGVTSMIPLKYKSRYYEISKEWEKITNLILEHVEYKRMIIRDVSNYLAISTDGKIKRKGLFKLHSEMLNDGEYQKAFNQGIVPIALSNYYLHDIAIEETIEKCKDIYLFCKSFNTKGNFVCETLDIDDDGNEYNIKEQQKTIRYYVSNNGKSLRKRGTPLAPRYNKNNEYIEENEITIINSLIPEVEEQVEEQLFFDYIESRKQLKLVINCEGDIYKILSKNQKYLNYIYQVNSVEINKSIEYSIYCEMDWRLIDIEAGVLVTIFNKFEEKEFSEYDVNIEYYIDQCYLIVDTISGEKERKIIQEKSRREQEKRKRERDNYLEYCIYKNPTERQYNLYKRDWLIEELGEPKEIKPSKVKPLFWGFEEDKFLTADPQ